jgi:hypothetical protein
MRGRCATAALLGAAVFLAGCEALLVEPMPAPEARFSFETTSQAVAAYGDLEPILEGVGSVQFRFVSGEHVRDTTVEARYDEHSLTARLTLRPEEAVGWLDVQATLRMAGTGYALFRGRALVQTYRTAPSAELAVEPVALTVEITPSSRTIRSLGDTLQLTAEVVSATGHVIEGAPVDWASLDLDVIEMLPDGRAIPRGNGTVTVRASSLGSQILRAYNVSQTVARFTGFGPPDTTIAVGDAFQLRPYGEDPDGFPLLPGADVPWVAGGSVSVGPTGTVTTATPGAGWVEVSIGGVLHRMDVTVTP